MPRQSTVTGIQLENLATSLAPTVEVINEINDALAPLFVQAISKTLTSLIKLIQECAQLLENIHQVLYAIIDLHPKSEAAGSLSPEKTEHVGKFMKYEVHA
ncbi:hypothetical protein C8R45DRAFT_932917 [Mycena sanguinolenta]|nr:hypothetical protein C8R45DRAFT_932917 [Mycena sanguinolenta]